MPLLYPLILLFSYYNIMFLLCCDGNTFLPQSAQSAFVLIGFFAPYFAAQRSGLPSRDCSEKYNTFNLKNIDHSPQSLHNAGRTMGTNGNVIASNVQQGLYKLGGGEGSDTNVLLADKLFRVISTRAAPNSYQRKLIREEHENMDAPR